MNRTILVTIAALWLSINVTAQAQIVSDGGLELGTPNPIWYESSTNFASPICNQAQCGSFFGGPFEGDWWAWFGGTTVLEIGSLSQPVTIPSGTATLTFLLDITAASGNGVDFLTVSLDGIDRFTVLESEMGAHHPWTEVTVDISSFADGRSHLLSFDSTVTGPMRTNFFVDAIEIIAKTGCPADLDGDGTVGILDLLALLAAWGTDPGGPPDFDGDGAVGILDLLALLANWGPCP